MRGLRNVIVPVIVVLILPSIASAKRGKEHMPLPGKLYAWDFQADTLGLKPAYSKVFGGSWQVVEDSTAQVESRDSTAAAAPLPRVLVQADTGDGVAYHYLNFSRPTLADLDASVRFRIRSGEIDPSAGLLFQMDPKGTSGYLVRVVGNDSEVAFHYLLYGKRRDVKFAKITPPAPGTWHTLAVSRRGTVLKVSYDGQQIMMVRDDRFSKGTVGVWTEDDTKVDFAELTATAR